MASSARPGGVRRVLAKCKASIEAGHFYEAHQMYRTLYFRYTAQQRFTDAIELLYEGSLTLLQHAQNGSGTDLALLLIDLLSSSSTAVSGEHIEKVVELFQLMDKECPERQPYVTASVRWTMKVDKTYKMGHPDLHKRFGEAYWQEKSYAQSRYHFLHSTDGRGCGLMLIEYHTSKGYRSEVDLFIAQAVLQYLCLSNKDTAHNAFFTFTKGHPAITTGPPFFKPLLNFIWLLLLALETPRLAVFTILCEQYEPSIKRDPAYKEYLDKIGQLFFGVPPPKITPQRGIFDNLLQSLFDGPDEGVDDASVASTSDQSGSRTPEVKIMDLD